MIRHLKIWPHFVKEYLSHRFLRKRKKVEGLCAQTKKKGKLKNGGKDEKKNLKDST